MALARIKRKTARADYWPGFVDAMATILLVMIFLLSLFMLAQFFLSREISGRDSVLNRLNAQITQLNEMLALERAGKSELEETLALMSSGLASSEQEREQLQGLLSVRSEAEGQANEQIVELNATLDEERQISTRALAQVELLNQQLGALRRQIASLEGALEVSEQRERENTSQIADLGRRLNLALAQRVQELSRYRSDFFGRLREILSQRSDIRVVGDRFVFPSEVLFDSGSDELNEDGIRELDKLAQAILELQQQIPEEISWVLRIDGHTDSQPIASERFSSNWELSAARSISVVEYLASRGVPPERLMAAGFGEFQPLDTGQTPEALARNRRIELKLTQR